MFKIQEIGRSCDFETVEFLIYKDDNWVWISGLCYEPYGLNESCEI